MLHTYKLRFCWQADCELWNLLFLSNSLTGKPDVDNLKEAIGNSWSSCTLYPTHVASLFIFFLVTLVCSFSLTTPNFVTTWIWTSLVRKNCGIQCSLPVYKNVLNVFSSSESFCAIHRLRYILRFWILLPLYQWRRLLRQLLARWSFTQLRCGLPGSSFRLTNPAKR